MKNVVSLAVLLCYFSKSVAADRCYPEYCEISTDLEPTSGSQCLLTKFQESRDCTELSFEDFAQKPPKDYETKFLLHAYVFKFSDEKVTAFNLSITNANFHGLVVRYRHLVDKSGSFCSRLQLHGNETHPVPEDLFISCPFSNELYESVQYELQYLVNGETYNYTKRYVFYVPRHEFIGEDVNIKRYTPFVYIDISYEPLFLLHIQYLPESYNVTDYRVWLINKDLGSVVETNVFSATNQQDHWYNFTERSGTFFFKVSAIHPDCGEYGCANSSTPFITTRGTSRHRLLIMIVSTVWIPPVILYAFYHLYKLYRREVLKRRGKPNCLLVYSPTRLTHIRAMVELAKYLRNCNVAVVDTIDAADSVESDPEYWCNAVYRDADVVLVATSPPPKKPVVSLIYRGNDNCLLKLMKENEYQKEKRYYALQLPYCKPDDLPEDLQHFKKFCLPKELPKLVKVIHKMEHMGCVSACDKEFIDSVKLAKLEILEEDSSMVKETQETESLIMSESILPLDNQSCKLEGDVVPQSFTTNIDDLDLLGETGDAGEMLAYKNSASNRAGAFRVDQLDL